jgi:methyl-accepting chemotaxis protein
VANYLKLSVWGPFVVRLLLVVGIIHGLYDKDYLEAIINSLGLAVGIAVTMRRTKTNQGGRKFLQLIYDSSDTVAEKSRNIFSSTDELTKQSAQQSAAVTESSSALEEISSLAANTAENVRSLVSATQTADQAITQGQRAMTMISSSISEIRSSSLVLSKTVQEKITQMERILQRLEEIRGKSVLIKDIVFQTKLLSFNASVEAARAGEHGKGFSVVAEEIGKLAVSSGDAAREIDTILDTSVSESSEVVSRLKTELTELVQKAEKNSLAGQTQANEGAEAFQEIVNQFSIVSQMTGQISNAVAEQEVGIREINQGIGSIQNSSEQILNSSEQLTQDSMVLRGLSEQLIEPIDQIGKILNIQIDKRHSAFDFSAAKKAHLDWKIKLNEYMKKRDGSLNPDNVKQDNLCKLGQWIYGEGSVYAAEKLFQDLKVQHANFHKAASNVIRAINANDLDLAKKLMAVDGEFYVASQVTVKLIEELTEATAK